ncbi:MAG: tRNA 2-thiocytidine(32) synthetase TtcA [Ruminococcus sp.]|nr:tRNA 2-thiocytidine(32) synthetase TtcA [Ruminococcus sp.]
MQKHCGMMRAAIDKYNMIENDDRIAVGVSGGKDSLALLRGLAEIRRYYPKHYTVVALIVDPCFNNTPADYSKIEKYCEENHIECIIKRTELSKIIFETRKAESPCSLCAKMRRGILHKMAKEAGCNKLALGHHSEDAAETFLMNLFQGGKASCFSPVTYLSESDLFVIRPMIFCDESKIASLAERYNFPVVKSLCPMDKNSERQRTGELLSELSKRYPDLKSKLIGALERGNLSGWKN